MTSDLFSWVGSGAGSFSKDGVLNLDHSEDGSILETKWNFYLYFFPGHCYVASVPPLSGYKIL